MAVADFTNQCVYMFDEKDQLVILAATVAIMASSVGLVGLHLIATIICSRLLQPQGTEV